MRQKKDAEAKKLIKDFEEEPELHVMNGRFGPYLQYKGQNFRIPKTEHKRVESLTLDECMKIINGQEEKPAGKTAGKGKRTYTRRNK